MIGIAKQHTAGDYGLDAKLVTAAGPDEWAATAAQGDWARCKDEAWTVVNRSDGSTRAVSGALRRTALTLRWAWQRPMVMALCDYSLANRR